MGTMDWSVIAWATQSRTIWSMHNWIDFSPSDQLSEEGEETKTAVQQPAEEGQNGLRMISTRKASAATAKQGIPAPVVG